MIREAFSNSKDDMETRLSGRMHTSLHEVGTEVAQERDARQLEEHPGAKPSKWDEEVDKSAVVIGGFADDVLQQAEETARVLPDVGGFKHVEIAGANSNIALARFDSPMHVLKFAHNQRRLRWPWTVARFCSKQINLWLSWAGIHQKIWWVGTSCSVWSPKWMGKLFQMPVRHFDGFKVDVE